jgi:hypothetical protein
MEHDELGTWTIIENETQRGQLLDGARHGIWLELVDGHVLLTWWARGVRVG